MNHSRAVAIELRAECARQRISGRELSRRLGENPNWTARRLTGQQELTIDDLYRMSEILGRYPGSFLPTVSRYEAAS